MASALIKAAALTFLTTATAAKGIETAAIADGATTPTAAMAAGTNMQGITAIQANTAGSGATTDKQQPVHGTGIYRFGTAIGAEKSTIDLSSGDNSIAVSAKGGETAISLSQSSMDTGNGNDSIELNAIAEGENSRINTSSSSYSSTRDDWSKSSGSNSSEYNYERSYGNWYRRYSKYSRK